MHKSQPVDHDMLRETATTPHRTAFQSHACRVTGFPKRHLRNANQLNAEQLGTHRQVPRHRVNVLGFDDWDGARFGRRQQRVQGRQLCANSLHLCRDLPLRRPSGHLNVVAASLGVSGVTHA